jgi:Flp pilus assembly protein TadD
MLHSVASSLRPIMACGLAALLCAACAPGGAELGPLAMSDPAGGGVAGGVTAAKPLTGAAPNPVTPVKTASLPDIEVSAPVASAIRQARSLRASGKKAEALELLDKTAGSGKDPALLAERGLMALELGQVEKAEQLLARAQDPKRPDWRLQSAYGAALSANGRQKEAQQQFAKALTAAPDQPSILNNLALSFALEGNHDAAEKILRQASDRTGDPQARQNLALILGLKGQVGEATAITVATLPPATAKENVAYFEKIGATRVSAADPSSAPAPVKSASVATDKPIMQLGIPD